MKHLKRIREKAGMPLESLAHLTGIKYSSVANYESGRQKAPADRAVVIAQVLNTTVEALIGKIGKVKK